MPEGLWELVQQCFKLDAAERPAVHVIADILSGMKLTAFTEIASVDMLTHFTPGRSRTAIKILSPEKGASILPSEVNSLCTPSPLAGVVGGKGKERVHLKRDTQLCSLDLCNWMGCLMPRSWSMACSMGFST
jgi:hypothetical protein